MRVAPGERDLFPPGSVWFTTDMAAVRDPVGPDLRSLTREPRATFLWGLCRPVVNRVLFAFARANDPEFYWLDLRDRNAPRDPGDPVERGWVPEDHLFLTDHPEEARPQDALGNLALLSVVRSDEPEKVLTRLSDFLRLPSVAQEIIARVGATDEPHVLVIANADRVRPYYPTSPDGVRPVLTPFLDNRVFPIFCASSPPGEGRWAFDFVLKVEAANLDDARSGSLRCESAPEGTPFRPGEATPLGSIPDIARALARDR